MAITIKTPQTPDYWFPSANPIVFTISTTTVAPRLSYIIDVLIDNVRVVQLKYPVYDKVNLDVDVRNIVNDYIKEDFVNDLTVNSNLTPHRYLYSQNEVCSVILRVTEEYFNGTGMIKDIAGTVVTKEFYVWMAGAGFQQRDLKKYEENFKWDTYGLRDNPKFMGPKNDSFNNGNVEVESTYLKANSAVFKHPYKIDMTTPRTIGFFTYGYDTLPYSISDEYKVWVYNSKMERTKEYIFTNGDTSYTINSYKRGLTQMPCSPAGINKMVDDGDWDTINLFGGAVQNHIDPQTDDDKYYVVFTHEGYGISYAYECGYRAVPFVIVPCSKYKVYNILYKTLEGSWWQIRTDLKHQNSTDVKKSIMFNTWGLHAGEVVPNSKTFKSVMHVEGNGSIVLNTDWIMSQGEIEEIEEMIVSPTVYLVTDDGIGNTVYVPVVLKDSEYSIKDKGQDKIVQYKFEFEEGYKKTTLI